MPANLINKAVIKELAAKAAGLDNDHGDARLKEVFNRLLYDVMVAIDDLDVSMNEFWAAVGYIGEAAKANELGLVVPGTALEHFLDLRLDEAERRAGLAGGTPTRSASTRSSARRSHPTTCVGESRPIARGATASVRSCHRAMAAHPARIQSNC